MTDVVGCCPGNADGGRGRRREANVDVHCCTVLVCEEAAADGVQKYSRSAFGLTSFLNISAFIAARNVIYIGHQALDKIARIVVQLGPCRTLKGYP